MDLKQLKKEGFLPQRQKGFFSLRLGVLGGRLESEDLEAAAGLARDFGRGQVHLTARQALEISFIRLEDIEAVKQRLAEAGLTPAALGPTLRTMTACQGASLCPSGLTLPQDMVETLERELDGRDLPHKFKVGLTGCHNNCLKAEENDLGLKGGLIPIWSRPDLCDFCGLCQRVCPAEAILVNREAGQLAFDSAKCVNCGRCFNRCPKNCWNGRTGWHLFFGGLFGNTIQTGRSLGPIETDEAAIVNRANRALDFYRANGRPKERFGRTITRLGWETLADFLSYR